MIISIKDGIRMGVLIGVLILSALIGFGSIHYLGKDNKVEEVMETVEDDIIEQELHLPPQSVHIDLSQN